MKINRQELVGDDVRSLTSNRKAGQRFEPPHVGSYVGATRRSERGIALVITLILLSVTLVMAIAFLAISRREAGSVTTSTDSAAARLAADAALANAQAQVIASVLAAGNPYGAGLVVSTNYISQFGFFNGAGSANPTNVSYVYANGNPLNTAADINQNIANLFYLPRAPVYVPNPANPSGPSDFRFYLDLDRNGLFEDSGLVPETNNLGNATGAKLSQVGDPQWVGVLERPDVPHGPNNKFVSRYAFVALPADGSLDLNAIHNQAKRINPNQDGFFRDQGIGTWEINLAAFLTDLNTNQWDPSVNQYLYNTNSSQPSTLGPGFDDALALLRFRYSANNPPSSATGSYLNLAGFPWDNGNLDEYANGGASGSLMTGSSWVNDFNDSGFGFPGADNPARFFDLSSDLFDPNKASINFTNRLALAGNGNGAANPSTYDRYTFYRMLAQMGTDSAPAQNQINLNYSNAVAYYNRNGVLTNVVFFANAQTNLVPWQPLDFFTITADRLLREYSTTWFQTDPTNYLATYYGIYTNYYYTDGSGFVHTNDASGLGLVNVPYFGVSNRIPSFGITNIPVLMNGRFTYTPAVQRVLQLAANIYDATTNQSPYLGRDYPSVFRPILYKTVLGSVTNVTIAGYQDIALLLRTIPFDSLQSQHAPLDPPDPVLGDVYTLKLGYTPDLKLAVNPIYGNVYGVPWIIGAKKGLPNFNEFSMQDVVKVTRKLLVTRPNTNSLPTATNQMYVVSITNSLGVEFWNAYTNGYTNLTQKLQVVVNDRLSMRMALTNGTVLYADGRTLAQNYVLGAQTNFNLWPPNTFLVPYATNFPILTNSVYDFGSVQFYGVGDNPNPVSFRQTTPSFPALPQIELDVTNQLQAFVLDRDTQGNYRVLDYVHFTGPGTSRNITREFQNTNTTVVGGGTAPYYTNLVWSTAPDNSGLPLGVSTQIGISSGAIGLNTVFWKDPNVHAEIDGFRHFLNPLNASLYGTQNNFMYATNLAVQVPYTPSAITYEYTTYQANDPLVHYLKSDLNYSGYDPDNNSPLRTGLHQQPANLANLPLLPDLGKSNARYQPWGQAPPNGQTGISQATYDENAYNAAFKDPLMTRADNWDFPTNRLPTVGWLGRVHRGTPWQTVYMKAADILPELNPINPSLGNVGTNTWAVWTSNPNPFDGVNAAPIQDRLLFDNFSTALNDNATRGQLSVNIGANGRPSLAAWSAVFSGLVVLSNATAFPQYQPLVNNSFIVNPAGPAGNSSVVGQWVTNINYLRARFTNTDGATGIFEHVGDILATPQLTEQSPFLNWNNANQQRYGINDEVYEWLPQQMLSLVRVAGSPQSPLRYVIYSYGQTLKPAPNGIVTGGGNLANGTSPFGMVTNYQVVAESATRAVVQVIPALVTNLDGSLKTNYSTKIEQFNVLPPD